MSSLSTNAAALAEFSRYIAQTKITMKNRYQQSLAADLARQQWQDCFQRNVLLVLEQTYGQTLDYLHNLDFDGNAAPVNRGFSALTGQVLAIFDGFVDEFLAFVVDKHRTSCALSNFPDEHKPDKTYVNSVKRDIAGLWQNFALQVNSYLLESSAETQQNHQKDFS